MRPACPGLVSAAPLVLLSFALLGPVATAHGQAPPGCSSGQNDDYLHEERFRAPDGSLACAEGVVIFDHHITPKFLRTIIPSIFDSTGVLIDLNLVDFAITLPETGEEVVYEDVFNWYENGERAIFNTNRLLWQRWQPWLVGGNTHTFNVRMTHRPTGIVISQAFNNHETMTLLFIGLAATDVASHARPALTLHCPPQPVRTGGTIEFSIPRPGPVTLNIYRVTGQRVATLAAGVRAAGRHQVEWNAADLPAGFYVCRLASAGQSLARPLLLVH